MKLNHVVKFVPEGRETIHTSSNKTGSTSSFLTNMVDINEYDAPESIKIYAEVWAIEI